MVEVIKTFDAHEYAKHYAKIQLIIQMINIMFILAPCIVGAVVFGINSDEWKRTDAQPSCYVTQIYFMILTLSVMDFVQIAFFITGSFLDYFDLMSDAPNKKLRTTSTCFSCYGVLFTLCNTGILISLNILIAKSCFKNKTPTLIAYLVCQWVSNVASVIFLVISYIFYTFIKVRAYRLEKESFIPLPPE
ncbi:hypothetical protein ABK040_010087 [Willaertia magna]